MHPGQPERASRLGLAQLNSSSPRSAGSDAGRTVINLDLWGREGQDLNLNLRAHCPVEQLKLGFGYMVLEGLGFELEV